MKNKDETAINNDLMMVGVVIDDLTSGKISDYFTSEAKKTAEKKRKALESKLLSLEKLIDGVKDSSKREEIQTRFQNYKDKKMKECTLESYSDMIPCYSEAINSVFNAFGIELQNIYNFYNVLLPNQYGYLINLFEKETSDKRKLITFAIHKIIDNSLDLYKSNFYELVDEFLERISEHDKIKLINSVKLEEISAECVEKSMEKIEKEATSKDLRKLISILQDKYAKKEESNFIASELADLFQEEENGYKPMDKEPGIGKNVLELINKLEKIRASKFTEESENVIANLLEHLKSNKKISLLSPNFVALAVGEGYDYNRFVEETSHEADEIKNTFSDFYKELHELFPKYRNDENDRMLMEDMLNSLFIMDEDSTNTMSEQLEELKIQNKIKNKLMALTIKDKDNRTYLITTFSNMNKEGENTACKTCDFQSCDSEYKKICPEKAEGDLVRYKNNKYDSVKMILELNDLDSFNIRTMFPLLTHIASTSQFIISDFDRMFSLGRFGDMTRTEALASYLKSKNWNIRN
ncbi:MAG: hypothetical protein PHW96_00470 [Candidatus Nanoarchaeia archaeon]|nr:hypothetical protein [Candidatus Nanoarchaeia archaeon]